MVRRILVTGGAGFIGSHLTESLLKAGHDVVVLDDLSTGRQQNLLTVAQHPRLTLVQGDAADETLMRDCLDGVDQVYHLAAAVGVALIAQQPLASITRNIQPTELLVRLLCQRQQQGRDVKLFLASSSEVYGKNPRDRFAEDDDLVFGPTDRLRWSYGASKAIDEFLALAAYQQYELPIVIGRFFNVVGPRQTGAYGMVLPRFVDAAQAGCPLQVHDNGQQVRCFAHVHDVANAVIQLMDQPAAVGKVVNIGSDEPTTILELAQRVIKRCGSSADIAFESYESAYGAKFEDIRRRVPDLARLRALIDYRPQYNLDRIIDDVAAQKETRPQ